MHQAHCVPFAHMNPGEPHAVPFGKKTWTGMHQRITWISHPGNPPRKCTSARHASVQLAHKTEIGLA